MRDLTSKGALTNQYIRPYLRNSKLFSEKILDFLYGLKADRTTSPTRKHTLEVIDILSIFWVNYKADKEVDRKRKAKKAARTKVIRALVGSVTNIDPHYTTGFKNKDPIEHIGEENGQID